MSDDTPTERLTAHHPDDCLPTPHHDSATPEPMPALTPTTRLTTDLGTAAKVVGALVAAVTYLAIQWHDVQTLKADVAKVQADVAVIRAAVAPVATRGTP